MEHWREQMQSENLLEGYRAEKIIEYTDGAIKYFLKKGGEKIKKESQKPHK